MAQVVVHATPETGVFDWPDFAGGSTLDVTIRRPPMHGPPPIHPACWKQAFITIKGILGPLESGIPTPVFAPAIGVIGTEGTFYGDFFSLTSSVPLGGDTFAVEYSMGVYQNPGPPIGLYNYIYHNDIYQNNPTPAAWSIPFTYNLQFRPGNRRRDFELTELYATFVTGEDCGPRPPDDPPVGDDFGDDDDDSPGASGQYRAIEADSPRNWLHVGSGASIVTYHTTPEELAFTSGAHAPKWWKQFCYNQRNSGVLACLGRDADPGSSTVYLSYDGGQTTEEAVNVTGTSVIMDYDSEREWLVVLAEGTPPDVEDPTSHGVVSRLISRDFGQNFTEEGNVTIDGDPLSARLLGMTYDPRTGGTFYLLCKILGVTKILASEDGGDSWEERFS